MNSMISIFLTSNGIDPFYVKAGILALILILFLILLIMQIRLMGKFKKLYRTYDRFMRGKDMESMEELIMKRFDDMDKMLEDTEKNVNDIKTLFDNMKDTVQKAGVVKYDAFNEMGGKLSFALAMLDGNNTGFVINSMHSREGCYTYIKEIIDGKSYIPLGAEEQKALNQAMDMMEEE